jgi:hypothetical protein
MTKLSTATDGAVLAVQQGPTEANTVAKLTVKDSTGKNMFGVTPMGRVGIGTATPELTLDVTVDEASTYQANFAGMLMTNYTNSGFAFPGFVGRSARGTIAVPAASKNNDQLFAFGARGHDGTNFSQWSQALVTLKADGDWTPTSYGTYVSINTTAPGTTARSERMRIGGNGNVGIGTASPMQKLEVNGGVRMNATTARPACDSTIRGTFWFTQGAGSADDSVAVCSQFGGSYIWKPLL